MPEKSDNGFKFFHELKRRKVIRVIIGYAAASYVILELISIIAEPFGLPDWTLKLVFILLCVGFLFSVFFSWVFDITPKGIKKTESARAAKTKAQPEPVKRKLRVSDIIIAILLVAVVILAYPRVFKRGVDLNDMTNTATIVNEFGEKETRQVFKEKYVHKLMIVPFESETKDSVKSWVGFGIIEGIRNDLLQFQYMLPFIDTGAIHLQAQIKAAERNNLSYFLTGSYRVKEANYEITTNLRETVNGAVKARNIYEGKDLFALLDSISLQTRLDMGVPVELIDLYPDLPVKEYTTESIEAYKHYIFGNFWENFQPTHFAIDEFEEATKYDSTFALAFFRLAWLQHFGSISQISASENINRAMDLRDRLPEYLEMQVRIEKYLIDGEKEKAVDLAEILYPSQPYNIEFIKFFRDNVCQVYFLNTKRIELNTKLLEFVPDFTDFQVDLAWSYLLANRLKEGLKYTKNKIEETPDNFYFRFREGQFYLHMGNLEEAKSSFHAASIIDPRFEIGCSYMIDHINYISDHNINPDDFIKFAGFYRNDQHEMSGEFMIQNNRLLFKGTNQPWIYKYPLSDTSFVGNFFPWGARLQKFCINEEGKTVKDIFSGSEAPGYFMTLWKEDSSIIRAKELLESNHHEEALVAFKKAYTENPEHFYLANYIEHLEFVLSPEYEEFRSQPGKYCGEFLSSDGYGREIIIEHGKITYCHPYGKMRLLPLSENRFMNPSWYRSIYTFIEEDDEIRGISISDIYLGDDFYEKIK